MHWLKLWHGTTTDTRLRVAGAESESGTAAAVAVYVGLLEAASQAADRGSVAGVRPIALDVALDLRHGTAARVLDALRAGGMITADGRIAGWEETQAVPMIPAPTAATATAPCAPSTSRQGGASWTAATETAASRRRAMTSTERSRLCRARKRARLEAERASAGRILAASAMPDAAAAEACNANATADATPVQRSATKCNEVQRRCNDLQRNCNENVAPRARAFPIQDQEERREEYKTPPQPPVTRNAAPRPEDGVVCVSAHADFLPDEPDLDAELAMVGADLNFQQLFDAYPAAHRRNVLAAVDEWEKLRRRRIAPGFQRWMSSLEGWLESPQWRRDGGRYIPELASWLRSGAWMTVPERGDVRSMGADDFMGELRRATDRGRSYVDGLMDEIRMDERCAA